MHALNRRERSTKALIASATSATTSRGSRACSPTSRSAIASGDAPGRARITSRQHACLKLLAHLAFVQAQRRRDRKTCLGVFLHHHVLRR